MPTDHPALKAYNAHSGRKSPDVVRYYAELMRDELLARIEALEAELAKSAELIESLRMFKDENERLAKKYKAELAAERGKRCRTCGWFQMKHWSPRPQCMCEECSFDEEPSPEYGCVHWQSAEQGGEG